MYFECQDVPRSSMIGQRERSTEFVTLIPSMIGASRSETDLLLPDFGILVACTLAILQDTRF